MGMSGAWWTLSLQSNSQAAIRGASENLALRIVEAACNFFGVTPEELKSKKRATTITLARWAIYHVLVHRVGWSSVRIGNLLNKDHAGVLYGLRQARDLYKRDEIFFGAIQELEARIV